MEEKQQEIVDVDEMHQEYICKKEIITIVSNIDNKIFIHTSIKVCDSNEEENLKNTKEISSNNSYLNEIVDINKSTIKLDCDNIRSLILDSIAPGFSEKIKGRSKINEINQQMSKENSDAFEDSESCFGLNERNKHQKLSHSQIKFLKTALNSLSMNITELSLKYNVSRSLLTKIKNLSWEQINRTPV